MPGLLHRVAVYWGAREDPELAARWKSEDPDLATRALGLAIGALGLVVVATLFVLAIRLVLGVDRSLSSAVVGGLALIWGVAVLSALAVGVARWIRWFSERRKF
jgi:hypothetical protein